MPIRLNFKKWIGGFVAIGGAALFYPNENDHTQSSEKQSWIIPPSSWGRWDHNWDRLYSLLLLYLFIKILLILQINNYI